MKRILSGAKPTGELTLGNYLGAMKRWVELQAEGEVLYFVANLHALNIRQQPGDLARRTLETAAWLIAMGIDARKTTLFVESDIAAVPQLFAILNNYVTMGELSRMTQFKDKAQKLGPEGQVVGLFEYPVLMAADILLFDVDLVPVGADQKQHVEIARDIADRFNNLYGKVFTVPEPLIQTEGARIMNLQEPTRKMSKSDQDSSGYIMLTDSMKVVEAKIMSAVTDSGSTIKAAEGRPAMTNLLTIYSLLSDRSIADLERAYEGKGYGDFKADLAREVVNKLHPLQERYHDLMSDKDKLLLILQEGSDKANTIASQRLDDVKAKLGLF